MFLSKKLLMGGWAPQIDEIYWQNNTYNLLSNDSYLPVCANESKVVVYEYYYKKIIPLNITDSLNAYVDGTVLSGNPTMYDPIASNEDAENMVFYDNTGNSSTITHTTYRVNPSTCNVLANHLRTTNTAGKEFDPNNYYETSTGYVYAVKNYSVMHNVNVYTSPKYYDQSGTNVYNRWETGKFRISNDFKYVTRGYIMTYRFPTPGGSSIGYPTVLKNGSTDTQYIFNPATGESVSIECPIDTSTLCISDGNHLYGIIEEQVNSVSTMFLRKFDMSGNVVLEKKIMNNSGILADGIIAGADNKYLYFIELPLDANYPEAYLRRIRMDNFDEEGSVKLPNKFKIQSVVPGTTAYDIYRRMKFHYVSCNKHGTIPCYFTKNGYMVLVVEAQSLSGTYHWDALRIKV